MSLRRLSLMASVAVVLLGGGVGEGIQAQELPAHPPQGPTEPPLITGVPQNISSVPDTIPPRVVASFPPDGAQNIDPDVINREGILIVFSEPIDTNSIVVSLYGDGQTLNWPIQSRGDSSLTIFRNGLHSPPLVVDNSYRLTMSGVRDRAGRIASEISITFTTSATFSPDSVEVGPTDNIITTVAGNGTIGFYGDNGLATQASLDAPTGVFVTPEGVLYIADFHNNLIRKVDQSGVISTVAGKVVIDYPGAPGWGYAGYSGDGGPAVQAALWLPEDVFVDKAANLYIADTGNNRVRKIDSSGTITTIAGNGGYGHSGDGGPAIQASLRPNSIFVDGANNLFVGDLWDHTVRRVDSSGIITTIVGDGKWYLKGGASDGALSTEITLASVLDIFIDHIGNLYISEEARVRKVDSVSKIVTTIIGTTSNRTIPKICVDEEGNLFVSDNHVIRKVDASGNVTRIAGTGIPGFSGDGGLATQAQLNFPSGLFIDSKGDLYIADTGNHRIRKVPGVAVPAPFHIGVFSPSTIPDDTIHAAAPDTLSQPIPSDTLSSGLITLDFDLSPGDQGKVLFEGAQQGRIVDLELFAHDLPEITGWSAVLEFDPSQLRYVSGSFQPGTFLPGLVPLSISKSDQVEVGGAMLGTGVKQVDKEPIGVLSFEVLPGFGGQAQLTLTQIKLHRTDGTVTSQAVPFPVLLAAGPQTAMSPVISMDFDLDPRNQGTRLATQTNPVYTLQLHISATPPISGWSASIEYDPRQVRYVGESFQPGEFLPGLTPLVDAQEGRLSVGGALLATPVPNSGNGLLGQLSFEVLDGFSGSAVLTLSGFSLRLASGERYQSVLRTAATIYHAPSQLVLDFDLAPGDQQRRSLSGVVMGNTYLVQLFLHRTPAIRGWSAALRYDPERLRYVNGSFEPSDFIPGLVPLVDEKEGVVNFGGSTLGTEGSGAGDGPLGTLAFAVLSEFTGSTLLRLTELTLRPLEGEPQKQALGSTASLVGSPPPSLSLDFDLQEGDQEKGTQAQVALGQVYPVQLHIRDTPAINGWSAAIGYDPEQLRYVEGSFRTGDFIPGLVSLVYTKRDSVIIGGSVLGSTAWNTARGTLGQVSFEVLPGFTGVTWISIPGFSLRLLDGKVLKETTLSQALLISGIGGGTAVEGEITLPGRTALLPGFPNPFNSTLVLPYQLAEAGTVRIEVFDLNGQRVKSLANDFQAAGDYQVRWDGTDDGGKPLSSGLYLARMQAMGTAQVQKLMLLK